MSRVHTRWYPPRSSSPFASPHGILIEAISAPEYRLRWRVGKDAVGFAAGRARISDEAWIAMGADLPDDEYIPLMAIQAVDKQRAVDAMDTVRSLLARYRPDLGAG